MAQPEIVFKIGYSSVSIFVNETVTDAGETRAYRSVSLQRRYRDGDQWKHSTSFGLSDLPAAIELLKLALDHVAVHESIVTRSDRGEE